MNDVSDSDDTDLCLGNIKSDGTDVSCLKEPSFAVIRHLHWATGRALDPRRRRQAPGGLGHLRHRALDA